MLLNRKSMYVSMPAPIKVTLCVGLNNENIRSAKKAKLQAKKVLAKKVLSWNQINLKK